MEHGYSFIHELLYTTNVLDNTITFTDEMTEGLDAGREVLFSFIDNDYLVIEHETSETYATADGQTVFDIELPFTNYLELGNQVLVFRNRTFMDPERYTIDDTIGNTNEYEKSIGSLGISTILNSFVINRIPKAGNTIINLITTAAFANTTCGRQSGSIVIIMRNFSSKLVGQFKLNVRK